MQIKQDIVVTIQPNNGRFTCLARDSQMPGRMTGQQTVLKIQGAHV